MSIRPTTDRVKESVFGILGKQWEGVRGLDLFSGTGNLGLEAISRGAEHVFFVEQSKSALIVLRKNISLCGFESCANVLAVSVPRGLAYLGRRGECFHVIFADPPYDKGWVRRTINHILSHEVLSRDGIIVIEHSPNESLHETQEGLTTLRQEVYGDTSVSFLGFTIDDGERRL